MPLVSIYYESQWFLLYLMTIDSDLIIVLLERGTQLDVSEEAAE